MTTINPGTRIRILGQDGMRVCTGTVLTAHNYGTEHEPDWYIELNQDGFGYLYWKQSLDGGTLEILKEQ